MYFFCYPLSLKDFHTTAHKRMLAWLTKQANLYDLLTLPTEYPAL